MRKQGLLTFSLECLWKYTFVLQSLPCKPKVCEKCALSFSIPVPSRHCFRKYPPNSSRFSTVGTSHIFSSVFNAFENSRKNKFKFVSQQDLRTNHVRLRALPLAARCRRRRRNRRGRERRRRRGRRREAR